MSIYYIDVYIEYRCLYSIYIVRKKKKKSAFVEKLAFGDWGDVTNFDKICDRFLSQIKMSCTIYSYRLHFVTTQWLL